MSKHPNWQAYTVGDKVKIDGPYQRSRTMCLITEIQVNSDCGEFQYFTTAGVWVYHHEVKFLADATEQSVAEVKEYCVAADEDDADDEESD